MRILFFCGSLEPGRDGVGDYTWTLARACARLGHACGLVALNDVHAAQPVESEGIAGEALPILRLPAALPWVERVRLASDFRDRFRPDWQSLQLVGYGLQQKGILWTINAHLQRIFAECPLHIMFHELWVGLPPEAPLKHRVIGALQRLSVRRLCAMTRPALVTTSNPLYREALRRIGVASSILPLPGNIPIANPGDEWCELLCAAGVPEDRAGWWLGLFFGELYPQWKPEPFLTIARRAAKTAGRKLAFVSLGRVNAVGQGKWRQLQRDYADVTFITLGEQPFEAVSAIMQACDFAVSSSPWQLIGKSGAAAAMLDHGLPVIVTRQDAQCRFALPELPSDDPMFFLGDDTLESKMVAGLPRVPPRARADEIAARFCDLLARWAPVSG